MVASFEQLMQIANAIQAIETSNANGSEVIESGNNAGTGESAHRSSLPVVSSSHSDGCLGGPGGRI